MTVPRMLFTLTDSKLKDNTMSNLQARSQTCVVGVEKSVRNNHIVQNPRAYFILYVIKIKCIMYM